MFECNILNKQMMTKKTPDDEYRQLRHEPSPCTSTSIPVVPQVKCQWSLNLCFFSLRQHPIGSLNSSVHVIAVKSTRLQ